ncbi:MAG: hypothetical protein JEZ00_02700 [Anaerolineaceae bacterium]|nr:hypothetical protein [Anaerolineaceae bacterium]
MENKEIATLPFHVINEFMVSPYRLGILSQVFEQQKNISTSHSKGIHNIIKSSLKVPGFRNAALAPLPIKVKHAEQIFEKNPEFAKHILAGWYEINPELAKIVFSFLESREWKLLPLKLDRSNLPGILPTWPEKEDFETLTTAFVEAYPEYTDKTDDVTLMIVWISNRLPIEMKNPMEWEYVDAAK